MVSLDGALHAFFNSCEFAAKVVNKSIGMGLRFLFCRQEPEIPLDEYINRCVQHHFPPSLPECAVTSTPKHAVVSGGSIAGMMAAMLLEKEGYVVHVYEKRDTYTRNIQWLARQALADELAYIDKELATRFYKEVAKPLYNGSKHIKNGKRQIKSHLTYRDADPLELPNNASEMMASHSVFSIQAKVFETFLKTHISKSLPNIHFHTASISLEPRGTSYAVVERNEVPDLIVIAEGANSENRDRLKITQRSLTKKRFQIAGEICIDSGGVMIKHVRKENELRLLTGVVGHAGVEKTWIVADVDPSFNGADQTAIDAEFRRVAALALELPLETVNSKKIFGLHDEKLISVFELQQNAIATAAIGDNVILTGDAVGSCHWSTGGGMQIAAVSHIERIKTFISDLAQGVLKSEAMKKYSDGMLKDSQTWCGAGRRDFCIFAKDFWKEKIKDMVFG